MSIRHRKGATWAVLFLAASAAGLFAGCGGPDPGEFQIKAERTIESPGGGIDAEFMGVGGGGSYDHGAVTEKYEGPASLAPAWARPPALATPAAGGDG